MSLYEDLGEGVNKGMWRSYPRGKLPPSPKPPMPKVLKILSVGCSGVGKSSLIMVGTGLAPFSEEIRSTIGVQFSTKTMTSERGLSVTVQVPTMPSPSPSPLTPT